MSQLSNKLAFDQSKTWDSRPTLVTWDVQQKRKGRGAASSNSYLGNKRYLIVGAGWAGQTIALALAQINEKKIVGFVDDRRFVNNSVVVSKNNGVCSIPVLGHSGNLLEIARKHRAEGIVIAITHNRDNHLITQIIKCHEAGIPVYEMPDLYARLTKKIPVQHSNQHWIVPKLTVPPHDLYTFFHDATNYLISLAGLLFVFLPLFPFMALAIKLDSKGSVFYRQKRVGKNGQVFTLLKFRTMEKDADKNGHAWTIKNDRRITRVGKWLRKFRLDELPQLFNVLIGNMALIGPRPEAVDLVAQFSKEIPFYEYRYLVRPGISGWAQVNYGYTSSLEGALEKLQYDLYWIKNRSFWLDLKIIFKSIKVMLTGYGAV